MDTSAKSKLLRIRAQHLYICDNLSTTATTYYLSLSLRHTTVLVSINSQTHNSLLCGSNNLVALSFLIDLFFFIPSEQVNPFSVLLHIYSAAKCSTSSVGHMGRQSFLAQNSSAWVVLEDAQHIIQVLKRYKVLYQIICMCESTQTGAQRIKVQLQGTPGLKVLRQPPPSQVLSTN